MQLPAAIIFALVFFSLAGCDSLKTTPRSSKITTPETKTSNQVVIEKPGSSQSGDPTKSIGSQIVVPQITMVALGSQHTCAGDQNGRVQCWGKDERKDAENKSVDLLAPDGQFIDFGAGRTAKYLAAYSTQTCAILDNGKPYCWTVDSSQPLYSDFAFDENQQFIKIAAGRSHACAIDTLGAVWCFGGSDFIGSKITVGKNTFNTAVKINFTTNLKATNIDVAENYQNCALLVDGKKYCWANAASEVGTTWTSSDPLATALTSNCLLLENKTVLCSQGLNNPEVSGLTQISTGGAP